MHKAIGEIKKDLDENGRIENKKKDKESCLNDYSKSP
jgi:hypothetical protein